MARRRKKAKIWTLRFNGNKVLFTNTSQYPTERIKELLKFALEDVPDEALRGLAISIRNGSSSVAGYAYPYVCGVSQWISVAGVRRMITMRIGDPSKFPAKNYYSQKYTSVNEQIFNDWEEGLIHLTAHEARHQVQFVFKEKRSEVECEAFSGAVLNRFKESKNSQEKTLDNVEPVC